MRLIIFSDLHGNFQALEVFLNQVGELKYDRLVFCGDIFGYYYHQEEIIQRLEGLAGLIWLKGNHDRFFLNAYEDSTLEDQYIDRYGHSYENLKLRYSQEIYDRIQALPERVELTDEAGYKILLVHGTPENPLEGRLYPNNEITNPAQYEGYDYVLQGHTHCRMIKTCGETTIINPGAVGQPRDGRGHSFALLDTDSGEVTFYPFTMDYTELYKEIDVFDPNLTKLKEVLER